MNTALAQYLTDDTYAQRANDAVHAPLAWNTPTQPELSTLDAPEPEYVERLPLATPVKLWNGVEGVVSGHNPNDASRYRVSWFDTHFWAVRHLWTERHCFDVMGEVAVAKDAAALAR